MDVTYMGIIDHTLTLHFTLNGLHPIQGPERPAMFALTLVSAAESLYVLRRLRKALERTQHPHDL